METELPISRRELVEALEGIVTLLAWQTQLVHGLLEKLGQDDTPSPRGRPRPVRTKAKAKAPRAAGAGRQRRRAQGKKSRRAGGERD